MYRCCVEIYYDRDYEEDPDDLKVAQENWELHLAMVSFAAVLDVEGSIGRWAAEWWQTGNHTDAGLKSYLDWCIAGRGIYSNIRITVQ